MSSKRKFIVSGRLDPKRPFRQLEVRSEFESLAEAQGRSSDWCSLMKGLPKAKPETNIECVELPLMLYCSKCGQGLFKGDMCYFWRDAQWCVACAHTDGVPDGGFWDFLGDSAIGDIYGIESVV